jgi:NADH-quinone oxidoreductase subunit N
MLMGVCAVFQFERDAAGAVTGSAFLSTGYEAIVFYLIAYLLMNLGIFGVVIYLANKTGSEEIDDLRGLGWKSPWVSGALIVFLLSLTGIPPTAGFFAKYYLFYATVKAGYLWLVIIAILNTVVSLFYYFRIAKELFLKTEEQALFSAPRSVLLAGCVILLAAATVWFGLAPDGMNDAVVKAATSIHAQVGR